MAETWLSAQRAMRESRTGRLEQLVLTKKEGEVEMIGTPNPDLDLTIGRGRRAIA